VSLFRVLFSRARCQLLAITQPDVWQVRLLSIFLFVIRPDVCDAGNPLGCSIKLGRTDERSCQFAFATLTSRRQEAEAFRGIRGQIPSGEGVYRVESSAYSGRC